MPLILFVRPWFPSAFHWRLRTPSTISAYIRNDYRAKLKYVVTNISSIPVVLAALEPNCSCALLPFCYLIFKGHGMRSASSQVNSKTFPIPPVAVQVIVLPLPRLIVCCGCIRCFGLRVPLQEGLSYPIQSLGIRLLGRKVGLEPTTSKDGEPSILPTELLASYAST